MTDIRLYREKKNKKVMLFFGLAFLVLGIASVLFSQKVNWSSLLYLLAGMGYLYYAYFLGKKPIYILTDDEIISKKLFTIRIKVSHLKKVKYFAGTYSFITDDESIEIDKEELSEVSVNELNTYYKTIKNNFTSKDSTQKKASEDTF